MLEVCGDDGRVEDARKWGEEAYDLWRASEEVTIDDIRPVNVAYARIDARPPSDRISELFYWGLHASRDGELATMGGAHAEAWTLRGQVDESSDAHDVALAAGVSVLAHDELLEDGGIENLLDEAVDIDTDHVRRTLECERDRLPLAPTAVLESLVDGATETEPEQLFLARGIADGTPEPPQAALVNGEFGRLLRLLQESD